VLQALQIGAEESEGVRGPAVVAGAAGGLADVDPELVEGLPHGGEDAGAIGGGDRDLHRAVDLRLRIPAHLDLALRIGLEGLLALAAVDRDPAAAGHEADDLVAGERVTALGEAHE